MVLADLDPELDGLAIPAFQRASSGKVKNMGTELPIGSSPFGKTPP
jgi:hypothetical protein